MGQYWKPVNLTKREFIMPHKLGVGLKLIKQVGSWPGTGAALVLLCAAMPERRGGGDLQPNAIVGRWAGDRIALVGDYAEPGDVEFEEPADQIYVLCGEHGEYLGGDGSCVCEDKPGRHFTDITEQVAAVLEKELGGQFEGDGWRSWVSK